MKKSLLILGALAAILSSCQNTAKEAEEGKNEENLAPAGAIVYFDIDKVIEEYDMANDLRSVVETKVQSIQQEITRKQNRLQSDANSFQDKMNKGLITNSVAQVQYEKLQKQEAEFNQYAAQKQQEIAEEQQVMMNNILEAIRSYITEYNAEKGYSMILATQGSSSNLPAPVVLADPSLDITEDILAGLNAAYVADKGKGNK